MKIELNLNDDQTRKFQACADAAGMSIHRWIEECADVKAAAVIDAIQAPYRKERVNRIESNDTINTRNRRAAKRRHEAEEDMPQPQSEPMTPIMQSQRPRPATVFDPADAAERARQFNAKFRR